MTGKPPCGNLPEPLIPDKSKGNHFSGYEQDKTKGATPGRGTGRQRSYDRPQPSGTGRAAGKRATQVRGVPPTGGFADSERESVVATPSLSCSLPGFRPRPLRGFPGRGCPLGGRHLHTFFTYVEERGSNVPRRNVLLHRFCILILNERKVAPVHDVANCDTFSTTKSPERLSIRGVTDALCRAGAERGLRLYPRREHG